MKSVIVLTILFSNSLLAFAESIKGDITAVDPKATTVTITPPEGGIPRVLKTRPSVEVSVNGVKSKFTDLTVGMTATIDSKEPNYANGIQAGGGGAPGSVEQRIINTKWVWYESKGEFVTISFKPGGVGALNQWGWNNPWKVSSDGKSIEGITHGGTKYKMAFNPDFTKGRIFEGTGKPRDTKLIPK